MLNMRFIASVVMVIPALAMPQISPTSSVQYTMRLDVANADFLGLESALLAHPLTRHEVSATISTAHRQLQTGDPSLVVSYTIHCGASCHEITPIFDELTNSAAGTAYAASIIEAVNSAASQSGFSAPVVTSTAAEMASTIVIPQTVSIT
eukprot:SAG31_NODE_14615_length_796_cov_1.182209_2_plen_149_part_01